LRRPKLSTRKFSAWKKKKKKGNFQIPVGQEDTPASPI
jgi:hypothetical protein